MQKQSGRNGLKEEMIGLRTEREEVKMERERERKKQCMSVCDEPESLADCTSKHVPPCYHPAHFLEQSKQAIKEKSRVMRARLYNVQCTKGELHTNTHRYHLLTQHSIYYHWRGTFLSKAVNRTVSACILRAATSGGNRPTHRDSISAGLQADRGPQMCFLSNIFKFPLSGQSLSLQLC